jgi:hypothetical protein
MQVSSKATQSCARADDALAVRTPNVQQRRYQYLRVSGYDLERVGGSRDILFFDFRDKGLCLTINDALILLNG